MRTVAVALLLAALPIPLPAPPALAAESAPTALAGDPDPEVLRVRESAWRSWFAGDEAALAAVLPAEFVGIDMGDGPFSGLAATLAESRAFRERGGRLVSLEFPETRAQRYGDVVVLYGRFRVALEEEGKTTAYAGRLTEIFVRRDGRWWHPGWHLDLASTP